MSSELSTRMELMKASLAAMYPARIVTRDIKDPALNNNDKLRQGIYTFTSLAEADYTNTSGYVAQDGVHNFLLTGDLVVDENQPGTVVEDAEFVMLDEIKAWVRNLPPALCLISLKRASTSGQTEAPHGWVVAQMEYRP